MCRFFHKLSLLRYLIFAGVFSISPTSVSAQQPQTICPDDLKYLKNECYGELQLTNGRYDGYFVNNEFSGHGRLIFENGDIYEGEFSHHELNGNGSFDYANGSKYSGEFKDGNLSGRGKLIDVNGDIYEGDFIENEKSGWGKLTLSDG